MMAKVNVQPVAEVIDNMVKTLQHAAVDLERTASRMRERGDITYASEAMTTISNLTNQLRLDLLVTRPIRELQRASEN
jgi:hypothetical protein